jgi:predicted peroxiredoxin
MEDGDMVRSRLVLVFCLTLALVAGGSIVPAQNSSDGAKRVLIKMGHFTDDLHATFMALKLAKALQAEGALVTLFVNLEAVGLADKRRPQDLRWGQSSMSLEELYGGFVKNGGAVLVCPHCAKVVGLESASLRKGASIGAEKELARAILDADAILDY